MANSFTQKCIKTSKCQLIYRNISKRFIRNNEKTLKLEKFENLGNFHKLFLFLQSRPACTSQKASCRHPQLHCTPFLRWQISCSSKSGFQTDSLVSFIANFFSHHPPHPSSQKTVPAGLYMRLVHPPTRYQAGTRLLHLVSFQIGSIITVSHEGSETSKILRSIAPPAARLLPRPPPTRTLPGVRWVVRGTLQPPSNITSFQHRERCEPANFQKIAKFQIFSRQYAGPGNRNSTTTRCGCGLVG